MAKTTVRIRALKLCLLPAIIFFIRMVDASNVTLAWDPSPDQPIAYRVYYGIASHTYTSFVEVAAPATTATIGNLLANTTYYFAATALDSHRVESDFSDEAIKSAVPILTAPALNVTTVEDTPVPIILSAVNLGILSGPSHGRLSGLPPNLTYIPNSNFFGTDQFTYKISIGLLTVSANVTINVTPRNDAPTLNPIANIVVTQNSDARNIPLSGITSGAANEGQALAVTATSSDPTLIPTPSVSYSSPNSTGTLTFKPALNRSGSAIITVLVRDDQTSNNLNTRSFSVTVQGPPVIFNLTETSNDARTISLTWNTDQPANCFVEYGPTAAFGLAAAAPLGTTHALTLTNLFPSTIYYLRVTALSAAGTATQVATSETEPSSAVLWSTASGRLAAPMQSSSDPSAESGEYISSAVNWAGTASYTVDLPRGLNYRLWARIKVPPGGGSLFLSTDGAAETNLFASESPSGDQWWHWVLLTPAKGATNAAILPMEAGTRQITIRAGIASSPIDEFAMTNDPLWRPILPTISPVLKVARTSSSNATLSWTDPSGNAVGIAIEYSADGLNFSPCPPSSAARSSITLGNLGVETTYYFRIYSYNAVDRTDYSNIAVAPAF